MDTLSIETYTGLQAHQIAETVAAVQAAGYVDAIATGDPFESTKAFMERFDHYIKAPGFGMVVAWLDGEPIGQAFGWPLSGSSTWWTGLTLDADQPAHAEFTRETGIRTFALSEIMVSKTQAGHGYASAMVRHLLAERTEERVTGLVNPTNDAYTIYRHWGAQRVGTLKPSWRGAPTFDALIADLPLR